MSTKNKSYAKAIQYSIKPIIDEIKELKSDLKSLSKRLLNEDNIAIDLPRIALQFKRTADDLIVKEKQLDVVIKTLLYSIDDSGNEENWESVNKWIKLETKFIYN